MSRKEIFKKIKYSLRFLPDRTYIQLYYFIRFRHLCNFRSPKLYNEKQNWLKLYNRKPEYVYMVDKIEAKSYVAGVIGQEHIIPLYGVWEHFDDIDFETLPDQFVLKCSHDSKSTLIVKNKSKFKKAQAKRTIETALKYNFFYFCREWPYKRVKPRILVEAYMEDHIDGELRDYRFFCFNGEPKVMKITSNLDNKKINVDYYDMDFKHLNFSPKGNASKPPRKPTTFNQMVEFSKLLSKDIPSLRVDFYEVDGRFYFGELTFFNNGGFRSFTPREWDRIFGNWLELPEEKIEEL